MSLIVDSESKSYSYTSVNEDGISTYVARVLKDTPIPARGHSYGVVAVKTKKGIFRAIKRTYNPYYDASSMIEELLKIVGVLDSFNIWTGFTYHMPYYMFEEMPYKMPGFIGSGIWRSPVINWQNQTFGDLVLLYRPRGW